ncbi:MAG: hypothetical protein GX159_07275 [Flavobacteriaceae bacterium]|nr:hypothetical protein [Flavobacteriaceae bacterium]
MKLNKNIKTAVLAVSSLFVFSCSSDDDAPNIDEGGVGALQVKFENGFSNLGNIVLNQTTQTSANGQKHQFSTLKYVVSNITLIKSDGTEFAYHYNDPDKGAFIVNQEDAVGGVVYLDLNEIPQGQYTKMRFGLGINQEAYLLGHDGQAGFWSKATEEGMTWSWAAGYIFTKIEGKYGTESPDTEFMNHTGNMGDVSQNGTPDLYREITLDLPNTAQVTSSIVPSVHILADWNQYLSGETHLTLDASNDMAMGSSQHLVDVTNNLTKMFTVDHVHND